MFSVTISQRAEKNLDEIIHYLESEWSISVRDNFLALLKEKIEFIASNPWMYQASKKRKRIRRCVVGSQNIIYYQIKGNEVEIITVQDARRNPRKLKL